MPFTWTNEDIAFFSNNKIYVIGKSATNPVYIDLTDKASGWRTDSTIDTSLFSSELLQEQYGASINGIFYFVPHGQTWDGIGQHLGKYDPITPVFNADFALVNSTGTGGNSRPNQYHCVTSNGVDTIYIYDYGQLLLRMVDINNPANGETLCYINGVDTIYIYDYGQLLLRMVDINNPANGETTRIIDSGNNGNRAVCNYYNGNLYIFGGGGRNDITKLNVGINNENFATATWTQLTITMPATQYHHGFSVLAGNNLIYLGGYANYPKEIWSFDPENESQNLIQQTDLDEERRTASFIYATGYDDRLYMVGGISSSPEIGRNDFEYSNAIVQAVTNTLSNNDQIDPDDQIISSNGEYYATLTSDGNFGIYYSDGDILLWSAEKSGSGSAPYRLIMQDDNNLVLYDNDGAALFESNTDNQGTGSATLILQDTGFLEIVDSDGAVLW
eukprot:CAMPEP_0201592086 /NCGR_PEP_ID=MMETSP0190_2-20130828/190072_1 /ASSEMBLY_ACC=CAM_ASM_000263 /TAXON_ID=37353 /ORGANISM="Rosalina sp." /LENGTH=444 /DNA_ID=CAMNT_0048050693 /DNA_START=249 /DNA_END=1581 /DNA_ORIENTATION=-